MLELIFAKLEGGDAKAEISVAFYEVYNDKVYDTFDKVKGKSPKPLNITEGIDGNVEIPDLIWFKVNSCSEALSHLAKALKVSYLFY